MANSHRFLSFLSLPYPHVTSLGLVAWASLSLVCILLHEIDIGDNTSHHYLETAIRALVFTYVLITPSANIHPQSQK